MIYLDNAATSYPKPPAVITAHARALDIYGGNPGRGAHRLSLAAADMIYDCRCRLAEFFRSPAPEHIVFTGGATAALNLVIQGHAKKGDHILMSDREHNAVARPVFALADRMQIEYDIYRTEGDTLRNIEELIKPSTRLLIACHTSNVTGRTLPIEAIGRLCRRRGIFFAVDAAQSAGHRRIDLSTFPCDALCAPAHKGLLGAAGLGIAILSDDSGIPLILGGSGWDSQSRSMPSSLPERFEAGTLPTPAIAALRAGIDFIEAHGIEAIEENEKSVRRVILEGLSVIPGIQLYEPECEGGVLAFTHAAASPEAIAAELDRHSICVRAGYHCAPLAHRAIATPPGGCVRISTGYASTVRDAKRLLDVLFQFFNEKR